MRRRLRMLRDSGPRRLQRRGRLIEVFRACCRIDGMFSMRGGNFRLRASSYGAGTGAFCQRGERMLVYKCRVAFQTGINFEVPANAAPMTEPINCNRPSFATAIGPDLIYSSRASIRQIFSFAVNTPETQIASPPGRPFDDVVGWNGACFAAPRPEISRQSFQCVRCAWNAASSATQTRKTMICHGDFRDSRQDKAVMLSEAKHLSCLYCGIRANLIRDYSGFPQNDINYALLGAFAQCDHAGDRGR